MKRYNESAVDPAEAHASFLRSVLSLEPGAGPWHPFGAANQGESASDRVRPPGRNQRGAARRRDRPGKVSSEGTPTNS